MLLCVVVGAVIVMDNASYHSVTTDRIPNRSWRKAEIQEWLCEKQLYFHESYTIRELLEVVRVNKPATTYVIDEMVKAFGMTVCRLPPYHCELNPIEMVWSQIKRYVARNNKTFKLEDVKKLVLEAINEVTADQWNNYENHVVKVENEMKDLEHIQDRVIDKIIININSGESDDEDDLYSSDNEMSYCDVIMAEPLDGDLMID